MPKIQQLSAEKLNAALADLRDWSVVHGKLHAEFKFKDFVRAFGFMTQVAILAQAMDHHPAWSNLYSRVEIDLSTHEADDAITERDVKLARQISELLV